MAGKDLLTRLADAGEEALARLAESPGADRVVGYANAMRDRVDELQKKVRGIDALEKRVAELERRLEAVSGGTRGRGAARPAGATSRGGRSAAPSTATSGPAKARAGAKRGGAKTGGSAAKAKPAGAVSKSRAAAAKRGSSGKTGGASPG